MDKEMFLGRFFRPSSEIVRNREIMKTIKKRNKEYGGALFATFGRGDCRVHVFPTFVTVRTSDGTLFSRFYVSTVFGQKEIQITDHGDEEINSERFSRFIMSNLGKNPRIFDDPHGYNSDLKQLELKGKYIITSSGTHEYGEDGEMINIYNNCKLVDASNFGDIFAANIARVKGTQ